MEQSIDSGWQTQVLSTDNFGDLDAIRDFHNATEKSIIIIKFDVDNNTVVILYKKQQKSRHQSNVSLVHL